jgi:hypothetical protein
MRGLGRCGFSLLSVATFLLTLNAQTISEWNLVGKWKLDVARSTESQGLRHPTEASFDVSQATASHFKWESMAKYSIKGRGVWRVRGFDGAIDGKLYDCKDTKQCRQMSFVENNGTLQGTTIYADGETEYQTITVSPDGSTMTAQCSVETPKGKESWTEVWERVAEKKRK